MDLTDLAMWAYVILSLGIAIVVIAWPLESERRDAMQGVHGDRPRLPH